jgi:O-antigen ligase
VRPLLTESTSPRLDGAGDDLLRHALAVTYVSAMVFVLALPLFEALKNLAWLAFVVAAIAALWRLHQLGNRAPWGPFDSVLAVWMFSGFLIAPFAGLPSEEWTQSLDLIRMGSIAWLLVRLPWPHAWRWHLLAAALAATLIALGHGYWLFAIVKTKEYLELKSVGHVNHSAIYLVLMFGVAFAVALAESGRRQVFGAVTSVFLLIAIVLSQSRAALGVALVVALVLAVAVWSRRRWPLFIVIAGTGITALGMVALDADLVRKHVRNVKADNIMAYRPLIWARAVEGWRAYPWFGVGMGGFDQITDGHVERWVKARAEPYDAGRYQGTSHAHSLYFNTLVERGLVGSLPVIVLLVAWPWAWWRHRRHATANPVTHVVWLAAGGAWLTVLGIGLTNTTLHHEHGSLALLLLGLMGMRSTEREYD